MPIVLTPADVSEELAAPSSVVEAIEQNALGPASATIGGQTVVAKDIEQLIAADRYLKGQQATSRPGLGIRIQQIRPVY